MKPAPATSALAISAFDGSAATSACASSRGFLRAALAMRMAMLLCEVAVLRIARALDHHLRGISRLGQNRGNK